MLPAFVGVAGASATGSEDCTFFDAWLPDPGNEGLCYNKGFLKFSLGCMGFFGGVSGATHKKEQGFWTDPTAEGYILTTYEWFCGYCRGLRGIKFPMARLGCSANSASTGAVSTALAALQSN